MKGYDIIKSASKVVLSICGTPPQTNPYNCKISDYVLVHKLMNGELYYSFLTGELLHVRNYHEAFNYLARHRFVVNRDYNEKINIDKYQQIIKAIRQSQKPSFQTFEIVTTTHCNANCFYCYEKMFNKISMTDRKAYEVAEFIAQANSPIKLVWFGGEPLVNQSPINIVSKILIEKGINFSASLTTNGLLISDEIITKTTEWHINHVTITLDGTETTYNRIKNYKTDIKNPFARVLSNIEKLIQANICVTIRINIEQYNIADIIVLAEELRKRFYNCELVRFILRPLLNTNFDSTIESSDRESIYQLIMNEMVKMFDAGFEVAGALPSGISGHCCRADSGSYMVISPNGNVSFCTENFNDVSGGSINNGISSIRVPNLAESLYKKDIICDDCPKYPSCMPTKLCHVHKRTICTPSQRDYMLHEIKLSMLQEYRKFNKQNNQ